MNFSVESSGESFLKPLTGNPIELTMGPSTDSSMEPFRSDRIPREVVLTAVPDDLDELRGLPQEATSRTVVRTVSTAGSADGSMRNSRRNSPQGSLRSSLKSSMKGPAEELAEELVAVLRDAHHVPDCRALGEGARP